MELEAKLHAIKKPIMVLGTSSGAGKSLTVTAICRILKNLGEEPIPFKGQNMSNNAGVLSFGGRAVNISIEALIDFLQVVMELEGKNPNFPFFLWLCHCC